MTHSAETGRRFSPEECVEILSECDGIEECIRVLRKKAQRDLDWHLEENLRPKLRLVDGQKTD